MTHALSVKSQAICYPYAFQLFAVDCYRPSAQTLQNGCPGFGRQWSHGKNPRADPEWQRLL